MKHRHLAHSTSALAAFLAAGVSLALPASHALAGRHPEPSVYPLPTAWYLDFKHGIPKRIVVQAPGQKTPSAYWYLPYTVTNNSGREQDFFPDFEMVTQDGKVHRGDQNIPPAVFAAIKRAEGNDLLMPAAEIARMPLHQGEDQAKDGVAIWEEPMPRMGTFAIYANGLNNETALAVGEKGATVLDADKKPIVLRKTLELLYTIWGDEVKPGLDEVHAKSEQWIMR